MLRHSYCFFVTYCRRVFLYSLVLIILLFSCSAITARHDSVRDSLLHNEIFQLIEQSEQIRAEEVKEARNLARKAAKLASENDMIPEYAESLLALGKTFFYHNETDSAFRIFNKALNVIDDDSYPVLKADLHVSVASCYILQMNYDDALQEFEAALALNIPEEEEPGTMRNIYHNLAYIYKEQENYPEARFYFEKSFLISQRKGDTLALISTRNMIGDTYREEKKFSLAKTMLRSALKLADIAQTDRDRIAINNNLGSAYMDEGIFDSAKVYLLEALRLSEADSNVYGISVVNFNLGKVANGEGKPSEALVFLNRSLEVAKQFGFVDREMYALREIHKVLYSRKDFKSAYDVQTRYNVLKDSLEKIENRQETLRLESRFKLREYQREEEMLRSQNRFRTILLVGILIALLLSLIVVGVMISRFRTKQKLNHQLEFSNKQIVGQNHSINEKNVRLQQSLEELKEFSYIVSHDLREPLRIIGSYVTLMNHRFGEIIPAEGKEFMDFTVKGVHKMKHLLDDLHEYVMVETGHWNPQLVDFDEVLLRAKNLSSDMIRTEQATIISDNLPVILSDKNLGCQLFSELIMNAIKFRSENPPVITIKYRQIGPLHKFWVIDNGRGIIDINQQRIFSIFYQDNPVEAYPGTGIGLATCKKIVNLHQGEIRVESTRGVGTTFIFTLKSLKASVD